MIIKLECSLPKFSTISEAEVKTIQLGKPVKLLGCPATILALKLINENTGLYLEAEVDAGFNPYLVMHARYLNEKDDDDLINFLE